MPLYGRQEFILAQARWCIKLSVQGVYLEVVVMNAVASGWHAAVVTHLTEIVYALQGSFGATFRKPSAIRGDLVGHPVDERLLVGASGSSQMIAISLVPWGSEPHRRGGETSSPSPVCLFGMVAPDSKTGLDTSMVTAPPSHELLYKQIRELDPELKLHGGA